MKILERLLGLQLPTVKEVERRQLNAMQQEQMMQAHQAQPNEDAGLFEDGRIPLASIGIYVMDGNDCRVMIEWDENAETPEFSKTFSKVLYQIGEGEFKTAVARVLLQEQEDPRRAGFVQRVFKQWEKQYEDSKDVPAVDPSQALPGGGN